VVNHNGLLPAEQTKTSRAAIKMAQAIPSLKAY